MLWWILVGTGPTRGSRGGAERFVEGDIVDFDDSAIGSVGKVVPCFFQEVHSGEKCVEIGSETEGGASS